MKKKNSTDIDIKKKKNCDPQWEEKVVTELDPKITKVLSLKFKIGNLNMSKVPNRPVKIIWLESHSLGRVNWGMQEIIHL